VLALGCALPRADGYWQQNCEDTADDERNQSASKDAADIGQASNFSLVVSSRSCFHRFLEGLNKHFSRASTALNIITVTIIDSI
jgi:hypothetical protein